jgi:hypothetical protein
VAKLATHGGDPNIQQRYGDLMILLKRKSIDLVWDRVQWWAFVITVMNLQVPEQEGISWSILLTVCVGGGSVCSWHEKDQGVTCDKRIT